MRTENISEKTFYKFMNRLIGGSGITIGVVILFADLYVKNWVIAIVGIVCILSGWKQVVDNRFIADKEK